MKAFTTTFAGVERVLHLRLGELFDLEDACKASMGILYKRFASTEYSVRDVLYTLKLALIGGGMDAVEADRLVKDQIAVKPLAVLGSVCSDIILSVMAGRNDDADDDAEQSTDIHKPFDIGAIFLSLVKVGLSPQQVREMRYDDFTALMKAAKTDGKIDAPSEERYFEMLQAWEEREKTAKERSVDG